jgi:long-chain acyl-CoA synthetase
LKRIYYVGSPMPVQLLKKGLETWGLIFMQGYGQTESGPNLTILSNEDHDVVNKSAEEQRVLLSCGRPSIGVQMRIVNDDGRDVEPGEKGEIIAKSKHNMCEYWRRPDDTRHTIIDGWLHTGDIGYYDEKGYIYIADRKKDMIISGGENIYPREVEEVLYQHPCIREAAIIGIPDPYWVEKVHAVIALKPGENVTAEEIVNFCKSKIARYKAPKSVEFVDALPKNASGKILKREIREKYLDNTEN